MEKLNLTSPDLVQKNIEAIAAAFPNVITEVKDAQGNLQRAVDFDLLRQELSTVLVEGDKERYQLTWPGKRQAILQANAPINKTLRPVKEDSVDWDTTQNIYIEGDNLEALKLLQESYLNKVKCIYIDPPYNTGKDFIYKDDFRQSTEEYLKDSGQVDEEGNRLFQNNESNGRFHSDWLTMMMPRLKLARNLLKENGVIFVSIGNQEIENTIKICKEILGSENYLGLITWKARVKPVNIGEAKYRPQKETEYVVVFARNISSCEFLPLYTGGVRTYPHEINNRKYRIATILKSNRGTNYRSTMSFELNGYIPPEGQRWQAGDDVIKQLFADGYIEFREGTPFRRYFEDEEGAEHDPFYCFLEQDWTSTSEAGKLELSSILENNNHEFDTVKPTRLIRTLVMSCLNKDGEEVVLDFFSGSATTAHAVMQLNAEDGGNRQYIMVQLPEATTEDSEAYKAGYKNICEIGKERIRRAAKKIQEETGADIDYGFRVFRVDTGNMKDVYHSPQELHQDMFSDLTDNIKADRSGEDLLIQVMLACGLPLSLPMQTKEVMGQPVYYVAENSLVACFEEEVPEELVRLIAKEKPLRVVFRDSSFASDAARINVEEIFKALSPATEIKVL